MSLYKNENKKTSQARKKKKVSMDKRKRPTLQFVFKTPANFVAGRGKDDVSS
jgi:hypothetical protein